MSKVRNLLLIILIIISASCTDGSKDAANNEGTNLASIAVPDSRSGYRSEEYFSRIRDGKVTVGEEDVRESTFMLWSGRRSSNARVSYEWTEAVKFSEAKIYWYSDTSRIALPESVKISYLDNEDYILIDSIPGSEIGADKISMFSFDPIQTNGLRLEVTNREGKMSAISEWEVISYEDVDYTPIVTAGIDRTVIKGGKTYLSAGYRSVSDVEKTRWKKISGPGKVSFEDNEAQVTSASFTEPGDYVLEFTAKSGKLTGGSKLDVTVVNGPPDKRLDVVYTRKYKIDNQLWNARAKA